VGSNQGEDREVRNAINVGAPAGSLGSLSRNVGVSVGPPWPGGKIATDLKHDVRQVLQALCDRDRSIHEQRWSWEGLPGNFVYIFEWDRDSLKYRVHSFNLPFNPQQ
jgi:hypothetical protein